MPYRASMPFTPSAPGGRIPAERALSRAALHRVHTLLGLWPSIKYRLVEHEADALLGGYGCGFDVRTPSGGVGNPTMSRALRLASDRELRQLRLWDGVVERALATMGGRAGVRGRMAQAMRWRYLRRLSVGEVAQRFHVSPAAVIVWQRRFRVCVWEQLSGNRG